MTSDIASMPIQDRFNHLLEVISGQRFLKKQGLGNEVPFFICPFPPEEAVEMDRLQRQLPEQAGADRYPHARDQSLRPVHRAAQGARHLGPDPGDGSRLSQKTN